VRINRGGIVAQRRVRAVFGQRRHIGGLPPVDRTRAGVEQALHTGGAGKVQHPARALHELVEPSQRIAGVVCIGRCVHQVGVALLRCWQVVQIAMHQAQPRLTRVGRKTAEKRRRVAAQHGDLQVRTVQGRALGQIVQQAAANEARATRDEDAPPRQAQRLRVRQ
jgi:hypothetical protein